MKAKRTVGLLGISLLLIGSVDVGSTAGSPVTWEFAGEITSVRDDDDRLAGAVTVGSPFSGSFTFESTTPDSSPDNPGLGEYANAVLSVSGEVAGMPFLGSGDLFSAISIFDGPFGFTFDSYNIDILDIDTDFLGETSDFSFTVRDSTGTALSTDSLLRSPPDLASFDLRNFTLTTQSEAVGLAGEITFLTPEPTTLVLLALAALAGIRRVRRRAARVLMLIVLTGLLPLTWTAETLAQWTGGPVLIGGDDTDDHFLNEGKPYMREGFNFLGAQVTNGHTLAVCIGCDGDRR